jgi:hypothetical protein
MHSIRAALRKLSIQLTPIPENPDFCEQILSLLLSINCSSWYLGLASLRPSPSPRYSLQHVYVEMEEHALGLGDHEVLGSRSVADRLVIVILWVLVGL